MSRSILNAQEKSWPIQNTDLKHPAVSLYKTVTQNTLHCLGTYPEECNQTCSPPVSFTAMNETGPCREEGGHWQRALRSRGAAGLLGF